MQILPSTLSDIDAIFSLYTFATDHQKKVFNKHWQGFDRAMVETEIKEGRQFKIMEDDQIACIFAITYNDPLIWKEKDKDPAIYIHRISTHPSFRGRFYVKDIVAWAKDFATKNNKQFIRMDTFGDNDKLIDYYVKCGFTFLGLTAMENTTDLPKHYEGVTLSLFEIEV